MDTSPSISGLKPCYSAFRTVSARNKPPDASHFIKITNNFYCSHRYSRIIFVIRLHPSRRIAGDTSLRASVVRLDNPRISAASLRIHSKNTGYSMRSNHPDVSLWIHLRVFQDSGRAIQLFALFRYEINLLTRPILLRLTIISASAADLQEFSSLYSLSLLTISQGIRLRGFQLYASIIQESRQLRYESTRKTQDIV